MGLDDLFRRAWSSWMAPTGPESDMVLSSRVRLARNLAEVAFPHGMTAEQAQRVVDRVEEAVRELNRQKGLGHFTFIPLGVVPPLERQVLVEKHLISPQQVQQAEGRAVAIRDDEAVSIMVNEEDHLRIQCLAPGLGLDEALELCNRVDDALEKKLDYAYCEERGYLTACPTNVGTGLRASAMLHLPALVHSNQAGRVFGAIAKLGLAVRGFFGEGTEALGNIFQVSNQITLGQAEEEIVANLKGVSRQIIDQERQARETFLRDHRPQLEDRVHRSLGLLRHARVMSSQEAMQLLSDVRLGVAMGLVEGVRLETLNELMVLIRPAYLQKLAGGELDPFQRDWRRAALIREKLAGGR